uniref:Uncharacterized protein n=1 Tax=Octopus bimaculoides TaxID=37653 RepID=A0A0L8G140_OCTBM
MCVCVCVKTGIKRLILDEMTAISNTWNNLTKTKKKFFFFNFYTHKPQFFRQLL